MRVVSFRGYDGMYQAQLRCSGIWVSYGLNVFMMHSVQWRVVGDVGLWEQVFTCLGPWPRGRDERRNEAARNVSLLLYD